MPRYYSEEFCRIFQEFYDEEEEEETWDPQEYITFSGHTEGPEAYQRWEKAIEDWFDSNQVPENEKAQIALDTLTYGAYVYCLLSDSLGTHEGKPDYNWEEMKQQMNEEFVKGAGKVDQYFVKKCIHISRPSRMIKSSNEEEENSEPSQGVSSKDEQVSRTKLFEEGGYDEAPESTKTNHALIMEPVTLHEEEKGPASLGCGQDPTQTFSPTGFSTSRRTPDEVSAQKNLKINVKNSEINLDEFSAQLESPSKKNQPIISSHKGDMNFTSQVFFRPPVSDICPLIWMQRSNQEELIFKPSWSGILIQIRSLEKWNHTEPILYEGIIDFSNQTNPKLAGLDLPALFGDLRAYVKQLGCKLNCFEISTHQGESQAWNHINPNFNERVMIFTNKCDLHLPYFEGEQFGGYKAYVWRPGEFLHQREDHMIFLKCFLDPWIRRIQSNHGFILKISRYKIERSDGEQKKSNFF